MKHFLTALLAALALLSCNRAPETPFRVTDLQVDYCTTPLGIDAQEPRFSWKMESDRYDQKQASYRIVVTESATGTRVWDSGADNVHSSDVSVGVVYRGESLKPCTRYDWSVEVTSADAVTVQASSWFETGLMDSGWSDAHWISSGQPHFSKYRSHYNLDFDVCLAEGAREADFLFNWRDYGNFFRL